MPTTSEALAIGLEHHRAGRLQDAAAVFRQILAADPDHPDALHSLGLLTHETGQPELAVEFIARAISSKPTEGTFYRSLGSALRTLGKEAEATACYRQALALRPDDFAAHNDLGVALYGQGQPEEAAACFRNALRIGPDIADGHNNLGTALKAQGMLDEAIACYRRALELEPGDSTACGNLATALHGQGKIEEAIACYRRALELNPNDYVTHNNLGTALYDLGKLDDAVAACRKALEIQPRAADVLKNLGIALKAQHKRIEAVACLRRALEIDPDDPLTLASLGATLQELCRLDEAVACCRKALEIKPDCVAALLNLGAATRAQGRPAEAIACYRRALEFEPESSQAHSHLLYTLHFCPEYDARTIYEEHRRWSRRFADPLARFTQPHSNHQSADRRLRIGYVSPGFSEGATVTLFLPLLEAHDHERFEVFCYASVRSPDSLTERCRGLSDVWRDVNGVSDERLADLIREDRIDVLIDLTMHASDHRLAAFARKPAPVQVTYLAYCSTTGLNAIDFRLTDPYLDAPGGDLTVYSEQSIRLPQTYWCYRPLIQTPAVNALPALHCGHITFGCLNDFGKVSEPTLAAWLKLLQELPEARLLLHSQFGQHRQQVSNLFARHGLSPDRLMFVEKMPLAQYFQLYHRIDVALDPFPYGGGTTTCDALWMGVPVVTLAGQTAVGRGGLSILSNVGLEDLVARDGEQYVRTALELARDLPRLDCLRRSLRQRMQNSVLMDAPRFARSIESAFREMWQRWCAST